MCSDLLSCVFVKEILVKLDQILNDICVLIKEVIFQQAYQFFCMVITKAFSFFISLKKKEAQTHCKYSAITFPNEFCFMIVCDIG